jgi:asparaginyl-tRNA synthetase
VGLYSQVSCEMTGRSFPPLILSFSLVLPLSPLRFSKRFFYARPSRLRHKLETSSMLEGLLRQGMKLSDFDWYLGFHKEHDVKLHSGAGVGMARVAQFILGQTDIRDCVPFLINRDNVI